MKVHKRVSAALTWTLSTTQCGRALLGVEWSNGWELVSCAVCLKHRGAS